MKNILEKICGSFDLTDKGYSSRKLTAFIIVIMIIAIHIKWIALGNLTNIENVLMIDYGFVSALFGMTTYQTIKQTPKDETKN